MSFWRFFLIGLLQLGPVSCAIIAMRDDIKKTEQNVAGLEDKLADEKAKSDVLDAKKKALIEDLSSRQLSLEEMQSQLDQLQQQNHSINATTGDSLRRQRELDNRLNLLQDEIRELQKSNASSAKDTEERKRKITFLQKRIKDQLELGLRF